MATPQENIAKFQEISKRGLQDRLSPEIRSRYDEALSRGLFGQSQATPETAAPTKTFKEYQEAGVGRVSKVPEFETAIQESSKFTNELIESGQFSNLYQDLPIESVNTILRQLPEGPESAGQNPTDPVQVKKIKRLINLERIRLDNPELATQIESMPAYQSFAVGAGKKTEDIIQGAGRLIGLLDQDDVRDSPEYEALASVRPSAIAGEAATSIATMAIPATKVAAIPATGTRIAAGGGLGALEGGIPALGEGQDLPDVAKSAALGAGLQVLGGEIFNYNKLSPKQQSIVKELRDNPRNPDLAKFALIKGKPVKTPELKEAIKQVGDNKLIAVASNASKADKTAIRGMLDTVRKGRKDPLFSDDNRVGDIVGESLTDRVVSLKTLNKDAGKRIDVVAKRLKGKSVDASVPISKFQKAMDDLRVDYDPSAGLVNFKGSALEGGGAGATRDLIERIIPRLKKPNVDGADLHFIKRMIDKDVSFGKTPSGLGGEIDRSIKGLRADINESLREASPSYKRANVKYQKTVQAIDNLQKAAGGSVDLDSAKALGVSLRKLTSNTIGRDKLSRSINEIREVLGEYGVKFKNDIATQVNVANALDKRFKLAGETTLSSEVGKGIAGAVTKSKTQLGLEAVEKAVSKVAGGLDDQKALDALYKLVQ